MIYKKIKDSNYIWNPETTLVFNKNRKVVGRYLNNSVVSDSDSLRIAKNHNLPIDDSLEKIVNNFDSDSEEVVKEPLSYTAGSLRGEQSSVRDEFDFEQKMDSSGSSISLDSLERSFYDNHPAFQVEIVDKNRDIIPITPRQTSSITTDFVELLTDEFKHKLNCQVNELIYKIMDLESTLKNLNDDYEQLLLENQQLKKQLGK